MSQKYIKSKNNNSHNVKSFGKYYAKPVYDEKFINSDDCTANTITSRRVLFQPEIERIVVGSTIKENGKIVQKYVNRNFHPQFPEPPGQPV